LSRSVACGAGHDKGREGEEKGRRRGEKGIRGEKGRRRGEELEETRRKRGGLYMYASALWAMPCPSWAALESHLTPADTSKHMPRPK
jgi:hypothetical protein